MSQHVKRLSSIGFRYSCNRPSIGNSYVELFLIVLEQVFFGSGYECSVNSVLLPCFTTKIWNHVGSDNAAMCEPWNKLNSGKLCDVTSFRFVLVFHG